MWIFKQKNLGHLFSTEADIRKITCDAWLLPTNEQKNVLSSWTDGHKGNALAKIAAKDYSSFEFPANWGRCERRAAAPKAWDKSNGPMPILTITRSENAMKNKTHCNGTLMRFAILLMLGLQILCDIYRNVLDLY